MGCRENDGPPNIKGHEFFGKINWQHLEAGKAEPPFPPDVSAILFFCSIKAFIKIKFSFS